MVSMISDKGVKRSLNEDYGKYLETKEFSIYVVADGMGGHLAGEVASKMAVDIIGDYICENMTPELDKFQVKEVINKAFRKANKTIFEYSCNNESVMGMGTTATICMLREGYIIYAHIGDSRAYMIGKEITQITNDHSYVQELVKLGQITQEEAKHHPRRNYITRAMGVEEGVKPDVGIKTHKGELIMVCSDGLHGEIDDKEILDIVSSNNIKDSIMILTDLANERGGADNITIAIMEGDHSNV